mgnify:CR=1 FL=1
MIDPELGWFVNGEGPGDLTKSNPTNTFCGPKAKLLTIVLTISVPSYILKNTVPVTSTLTKKLSK